jgi:hypothetical protein
MQITLSPKTQFQALGDTPSHFKVWAANPELHSGITHAVAEMALTGVFNAEQMYAVNRFVDIFLNLAEKPEPMKTMPSKSLDHSLLERPMPEKNKRPEPEKGKP